MGHIIAVINNKGGVGKTTLTVNLGHTLAARKYKVLAVDLDSQINTSNILVPDEVQDTTLYELLEDKNGIYPEDAIYQTQYKYLYCLPNAEETGALELELIEQQQYGLLCQKLRDYLKNNFDYIFLDCPPNLLYFVMSALHTADFVLVPIQCSSNFSLDGLTKVIQRIDEIRKSQPDSTVKFLRLLINNVDKRTAISRILIDKIYKSIDNEKIFESTIPTNTAFSQAEYLKKSIINYAPSSPGARAYRKLADEIVSILPPENRE